MPALEKIKKELMERQSFLKERITEFEQSLRAGHSAKFSEQATEREEEEVTESLENSYLAELAKIEKALVRFDSDAYGVCDECGIDIPPARLEVLPYTDHCVDCESKIEQA